MMITKSKIELTTDVVTQKKEKIFNIFTFAGDVSTATLNERMLVHEKLFLFLLKQTKVHRILYNGSTLFCFSKSKQKKFVY
jgi:hypothetical protein